MIIEIPYISVRYPIGCDMDNVKRLINTFKDGFKQIGLSDEVEINLWCRGSSGSILATAFSFVIPNPCKVCHIKKPWESSHAGWADCFSKGVNVIIDDFVSTGSTIVAIYDHVTKERDLCASVIMVATGAERLTHLKITHVINCSNY